MKVQLLIALLVLAGAAFAQDAQQISAMKKAELIDGTRTLEGADVPQMERVWALFMVASGSGLRAAGPMHATEPGRKFLESAKLGEPATSQLLDYMKQALDDFNARGREAHQRMCQQKEALLTSTEVLNTRLQQDETESDAFREARVAELDSRLTASQRATLFAFADEKFASLSLIVAPKTADVRPQFAAACERS